MEEEIESEMVFAAIRIENWKRIRIWVGKETETRGGTYNIHYYIVVWFGEKKPAWG